MKFGINTLDDFSVKGKTVLLRVDLNQPVDQSSGKLKDTTRIQASVQTIRELSDSGAKVVILAHQGSDIEYGNFFTTEPHAQVLERLLETPVGFIDDVCGPAARAAVSALGNGEILLLDNVRFVSEEQTLFEKSLKLSHEQQAKTQVVKKLAPLGDLFVCDAFAAAHRDQPSLCGFEQVLPSAMGRLFEKEFSILSEIMAKPVRPCVFVLGGAKIADAFLMMDSVLERHIADQILTGGLVANVMLWASGVNIGEASKGFIRKQGYEEFVEKAKVLLDRFSERIVLPTDLAYIESNQRHTSDLADTPDSSMMLDIGGDTIKRYQNIILNAKTLFVNGPMGVFEQPETELGTKKIWEALGETLGYSVIGGGDSIAATNKYNKAEKIDYICTGGGALIRFLSGEELPVVRALKHGSTLKNNIHR